MTLRAKLRTLGPSLTPRTVLEKFATIEMIGVHLPINDQPGERLVMLRYTQPDKHMKLLLARMVMDLPSQPPLRIESVEAHNPRSSENPDVGQPF